MELTQALPRVSYMKGESLPLEVIFPNGAPENYQPFSAPAFSEPFSSTLQSGPAVRLGEVPVEGAPVEPIVAPGEPGAGAAPPPVVEPGKKSKGGKSLKKKSVRRACC